MKHGKKPTRQQMKLMQRWKLDPDNWLVVKDTPSEMVLVHRHFDSKTKVIPKGGGGFEWVMCNYFSIRWMH